MGAWLHFYFDTFFAKIIYIIQIIFSERGYQKIVHIQVANSIGEIIRSAASHVQFGFGGDYLIRSDVPYTTNIVHENMVKGAR
jgi:hypothetical protein